MTRASSAKIIHRGRIFPELRQTEEEKARKQAAREEFASRCRSVFDRLYPRYIETHSHCYVAIEPDSEDYFIALDPDSARQKAREKYPDRLTCTFGFNETGSCGRIGSRELSGVRENYFSRSNY